MSNVRNREKFRAWQRAYRKTPKGREMCRLQDVRRRAAKRAKLLAALAEEKRCCLICGTLIDPERVLRNRHIKYCKEACRQRGQYLNYLAARGEQPKQAPRPQNKPAPQPLPPPAPKQPDDPTEDERFERRWAQMQQEGRVWR